jgi:type VI secretion system secreted protein Hcp
VAFDAFLKIDGIPGESKDAKHRNEIDILSFSWGETNPPDRAAGGGGKVQLQDFHFVMRTQKSSPALMLACASGQHLKEAVLTCRKAGRVPFEFYKITLTDILVSSFQTGGSGGQVLPLEEVSFNFIKGEFQYTAPGGGKFVAIIQPGQAP